MRGMASDGRTPAGWRDILKDISVAEARLEPARKPLTLGR